ncbi:hypothetical protein [Cyanobium sp. A2C-AMD]|uniref:hypothetical protein n=1 Tax=Cyanobium sp. A2C-AMD TaxID=2823695 RepID=UPI0020CF6BA5|nr:hypothetical protein [Cyanobium sp. A2C-AMD]MCP9878060.1 hypothetical protein [Cyanobium sp. A2C-AMD]
MTDSALPEPLQTLALPDDALLLELPAAGASPRELAVLALQQSMAERRLQLPLGPQLELASPERLLNLNRFAVQLVCGGLMADQLAVPLAPWAEATTAPQLLLAALVDEEQGVVHFAGTLTATELQQAANPAADGLWLQVSALKGGVDRLFTLVQLLEPEALPRLAINPPELEAMAVFRRTAVQVLDWFAGQVDPALQALGAALLPAPAAQAAFRSLQAIEEIGDLQQALAVLELPLGIAGDGQLCSGTAAEQALERFRLLLIPTTSNPAAPGQPASSLPDGLLLRLEPTLREDLLPDGLSIQVQQGAVQQSVAATASNRLDLRFSNAAGLISVSLRYPGSAVLQIPPLQLPL